MPKYKSLLKDKKARPLLKKMTKKGGSITAGGIRDHNHFDEVHTMFFDKMEEDPEMLVHLLELMPESVFHLLQEISRQHVGGVDKYHMRMAEELDKSHELHAPLHDIAHNAKNMRHLIDALKKELHMEPTGGGLFKSIKRGFKRAMKFTNRNIIQKVPDIKKVQKKLNKIAHQIEPVVRTIDKVSGMYGAPQLSPFFNKAKDLINRPEIGKIANTIKDVQKISGEIDRAVN